MDQPVLILQGALDTEMPPAHADQLATLSTQRDDDLPPTYTRKIVLPGINHLLVAAKSGDVDEYSTLDQLSVSPEVSAAIAHTATAIFVSPPELWLMIVEGPRRHLEAFTLTLGFTAILMFNFTWFREQFCTVMCPYGRLQSVPEAKLAEAIPAVGVELQKLLSGQLPPEWRGGFLRLEWQPGRAKTARRCEVGAYPSCTPST